MGLAFFSLLARSVFLGFQTWTWQATPCTIVSNEVGESQNSRQTVQFQPGIKYNYAFAGKDFSSSMYEREPALYQDYGQAARLAAKYPPGVKSVCYVNSKAPGTAVLVRSRLWLALLCWFPLVFVAIGGTVVLSAWRRNPAPSALPHRTRRSKGKRVPVAFFSIFLFLGLAGAYVLFIHPVARILQAKNWSVVPCTVVSSEVATGTGRRGSTYRINILYQYEIKGHTYEANAYNFLGGSSSGWAGKQAVVNQNPPGTKTVCYVNPFDPFDAVLNPGFTGEMFFGLIPFVFFLIGSAGLFFTVRSHGRRAEADTARSVLSQ